MKKQLISLVAGLLFSTAAIYANQVPVSANRLIVSIEKSTDATSLDLRMANLEKQGTLILLQDVSGNNWFSHYVWHKHGFAKKLNLKGMPDGVYTLSVKHRDATIIQVLHLSKGVLEFSEHQKMEVPTEPGKDLVKG
ncbi:MAG: hypothetical protein IPM82_07805 [Saprospiraceae bacterium]|nr:hypothetical protein [Saprospiraceae bacterium]